MKGTVTDVERITEKIAKMPRGAVFVAMDFTDEASYDNVRKILTRLESDGEIRRVMPGVYDRPAFSKILNEEAAPDPDKVAQAIARKNNWTIAPSGAAALNLLGLSTQVMAKWEYISSGPSKEYLVGNVKVDFNHRADKEIAGMSQKTALIVQALKALGREQVTDGVINVMAGKVSVREREKMMVEARQTTSWIFEVIKQIYERSGRIYKIAKLPKEELDIIIGNVANKKGLSRAIVEKDLWVSMVLDYLFVLSPWRKRLAFKGGTSLSKAYGLIQRFSEDIDLILDWRVLGYELREPLAERTANQQDKMNKEILVRTEKFLKEEFIPRLEVDLEILGAAAKEIYYEDDAVIVVYGNNYTDEAILQVIRLEIGALAAWTPTEMRGIRPYIAEVYSERFGEMVSVVRTTTAERTFWEKVTILHREAFRPTGWKVASRMSRHYYDIYQMAKQGVMRRALMIPELLQQVTKFKMKFYPQKWARYDLARLGTLRLVPAKEGLAEIAKDYEQMAGMFYGEVPGFEEMMRVIAEIERELNETAEGKQKRY